MRKVIFALVFLGEMISSCALAQTCPPRIAGSVVLKPAISGWKATSDRQDFALQIVSIIAGPLSRHLAEPEAELKPMEKDGIQYWAFGAPIGKTEVWMRCQYAQTSVTLSKRVRSNTTLCFQPGDMSTEKAVKSKVVIMCVDSSHKANESLRPYQASLSQEKFMFDTTSVDALIDHVIMLDWINVMTLRLI
jgi:hypothetical protein